MSTVSVIMPVFNAAKYIESAIDSILDQSFKKFELILVDDGSKDGSGEICDRYAQKDDRVRVLHQSNHGLCYARNVGLDMAGGRYIIFADHDDIWLDGSFEHLVAVAESKSVDLIKGTWTGEIHNNDGSIKEYRIDMPTAELTYNELVNKYKWFNQSIRAVWNGMYRADIIRNNGVRFDESFKSGAEDYAFNLEYVKHINTIALTEKPIYRHFARANQSESVGYNENRQDGIKKVYHSEAAMLKEEHISDETYISHQVWYFYMMIKEFCFIDVPFGDSEISSRLRTFVEDMDNFRTITLSGVLLLAKKRPMTTAKWELMKHHFEGCLFKRYKSKQ